MHANPHVLHLLNPLLINKKIMWSFSSFPSEKWRFKFQMCFLITAYCKVVFFFWRIHLEPVKVATISPSFHLAWAWRRWPTPRRSPESEGKHGQRRQTLGQFLKFSRKKNPPRFRDTTWLGFFWCWKQLGFWKQLDLFSPQNIMESWITRKAGRWGPMTYSSTMILGTTFHDCWGKNFNWITEAFFFFVNLKWSKLLQNCC